MTNFSQIPTPWQTLIATAAEAEQHVYAAPRYSAMLCRSALEEWVRWIYKHDADLQLPYDDSLNSLLHEEGFKKLIAPNHFHRLNIIRRAGNNAVHTNKPISAQEALHCVKILHGFISWTISIYSEDRHTLRAFDVSIVPTATGKDKTQKELTELQTRYEESLQKLAKAEALLAEFKAAKEQNITHVPPPADPNEAITRKLYIDTLLTEARWDVTAPNVIEYEVSNCMPRAEGSLGTGYADYVLWGADGLPLAVVEAKRTSSDTRVGQHQAKLYADCLEKQFGQRPVIYFSNGFDTWMWDDLDYPPRMVFGFYTRDELQMLIHRRTTRQSLRDQKINPDITDRHYQITAIRAVGETLERKNRQALLVMATGTGKTRVSASIVDVLSKAGWIKRVLFLADRNALVTQAKRNFNDYLPHMPAIDLTKEKEDESSRIVFSTYQTLINMIDGEEVEGQRTYGPGHFDLIIFDEIHRSVYKRYKYIFSYFDGYKLGLTATPRAEADRDTYALFEMQKGDPTYAYELDQAVEEGFLVPPDPQSVPTKFQRQGIKYAELSQEEKLEYEEQFADPDTGAFPAEIDATALNQWLFNKDTVDKVIGYLMQHGLKVDGGDKLGKTIIFARSHKHALFIQERFNIQYPEYRGHFMGLIDYQQEYKHAMLDDFKVVDKMPQIALSVDMLDTGIDVPEVVNLVFFKPVRSSTKFWQMIGRGTRLCKDLFGPGMDKTFFKIFDLCENFEFFGKTPKGIDSKQPKSISQRLFELRLRLADMLVRIEDPLLRTYGEELIHFLQQQVQSLNPQSFIVRQHLRFVEKYRDPAQWNALNDLDIRELQLQIAPIVVETAEDETAKRFDQILYLLQLHTLHGDTDRLKIIGQIKDISHKLLKKTAIPMVQQREVTLREVQQNEFWDVAGVKTCERLRIELRDIIRFLDKDISPVYFTDFEDEIGEVKDMPLIFRQNDIEVYRQKVEQYFRENQHHLTIHKIKNNQPVTPREIDELEHMLFEQGVLESKEKFLKAYGDQPLVTFIRHIIGMDAGAARAIFSELLADTSLNVQQIRFLETIINAFIVNGAVSADQLFETPYTDFHTAGILGLFDEDRAYRIIRLVEGVSEGAVG